MNCLSLKLDGRFVHAIYNIDLIYSSEIFFVKFYLIKKNQSDIDT